MDSAEDEFVREFKHTYPKAILIHARYLNLGY